MTTGTANESSMAVARQTDIPDAVRIGTMTFVLIVILVGSNAFLDRTGAYLIEAGDGGNLVNQILFLIVGVVAGSLVLHRGLSTLRPLLTLPCLATLAWFVLTTMTSVTPATSGRRLASLFILFTATAAMLVVPRNSRQFATILGGTALAIVVICYAGLVLAPGLSIHDLLDLTEPEHAGNWRGLFNHKNSAGAMMATFVFIGLFWRRAGAPVLGTCLAFLSAIFLVFTFAKSAILLTQAVLIISWLFTQSSASWWRGLLIFGPVAALLLGSVGTVIIPPLASVVAAILGDASFTGRTEIWQFAIDNILKRPIMGYGYGAFWDSVFHGGGSDTESWVNSIKSAHNGYLSVALDFGLPGLGLVLWWYLLRPFRDLQKVNSGRRISPLVLVLMRLWLFVMLLTVFETALYVPVSANGLSFFVALSVFGLRYLTCTSVVSETDQPERQYVQSRV